MRNRLGQNVSDVKACRALYISMVVKRVKAEKNGVRRPIRYGTKPAFQYGSHTLVSGQWWRERKRKREKWRCKISKGRGPRSNLRLFPYLGHQCPSETTSKGVGGRGLKRLGCTYTILFTIFIAMIVMRTDWLIINGGTEAQKDGLSKKLI